MLLLCKDIIDTGRTLKHVVELLKHRQAQACATGTLTDKPERREELSKITLWGSMPTNSL